MHLTNYQDSTKRKILIKWYQQEKCFIFCNQSKLKLKKKKLINTILIYTFFFFCKHRFDTSEEIFIIRLNILFLTATLQNFEQKKKYKATFHFLFEHSQPIFWFQSLAYWLTYFRSIAHALKTLKKLRSFRLFQCTKWNFLVIYIMVAFSPLSPNPLFVISKKKKHF